MVRGCLAVALALALAACVTPPEGPPAPLPDRPVTPTPPPPSAESIAARAHYERVQRELLAQGLLRRDGGTDVTFSAEDLAETFIRIALYDEYVSQGGQLVARTAESRLRRWSGPIRMQVLFGDSVPEERRAKDRAAVLGYSQRLSRVSGLPIRLTEDAPNFHVLVVSEDERRASAELLRGLVPGISNPAVRTITGMPRTTFCLVFAFSEGVSPAYTRAVAVIRAEHPDLLRLSCIHEELAQAMGLANDSPEARPSIFNDDEEFGLLTKHDELLLRILYDPRLRPGMTVEEARPIVETIARELVPPES